MKKYLLLILALWMMMSVACSGEPTSEELYKNGLDAYNKGNKTEAVTALEKYIKAFPEEEEYPRVLFLYGYINANDLQKLDVAEKVYLEFLANFPDNELAESVKFELNNLGKSADNIVLPQNMADDK